MAEHVGNTVLYTPGNPVSGAEVYIYEQGTSTLATLYNNFEETIAKANPLLTDASGWWNCYIAPGRYDRKIVKGDVEKWVLDFRVVDSSFDGSSFAIADTLIHLGDNSTSNALDLGWFGEYNDGAAKYAGMYRDASDGKFHLFEGLETVPTATVDQAGTGYAPADLIIGDLTATTVHGHVPSALGLDLLAASDAAAAQALLDLEPGTDVLAYDANVAAIDQGLATTDSPTFAGLTSTGNAEVGGDLVVTGNLDVSGTYSKHDVATYEVSDPLVHYGHGNAGDAVDLGWVGEYTQATVKYAGLHRDASDGAFHLFEGLEVEPTDTVDHAGTGYTPADLVIGGLTATTLNGHAPTSLGLDLLGASGVGAAQALLDLEPGTDVLDYDANVAAIDQGLATTDDVAFAGLTVSSLTSGRVLVASTAGLLADDEGLLYNDTGSQHRLSVGNGTQGVLLSLDGGEGELRYCAIKTNGLTSWLFGGASNPHSGDDTGTPWQILAYDDSGNYIDAPFRLTRAAGGELALRRPVKITDTTASALSVSGGASIAGALSLGGALDLDGNQITDAGAIACTTIDCSSILASGAVTISGATACVDLTVNGYLKLTGGTSDPATLSDGMIWHRTDTDEIRVRLGGTTYTLDATAV